MVRTNQGGSILEFVIVGGVMALLLVGGVYLARHHLMPASNGTPITTEDDQAEEQPVEEEVAPKDEENAADTPKQEADSQHTSDVGQPTTGNTSPESLPQTGPADALLASLAIGSIIGGAVAYKRSRGVVASL